MIAYRAAVRPVIASLALLLVACAAPVATPTPAPRPVVVAAPTAVVRVNAAPVAPAGRLEVTVPGPPIDWSQPNPNDPRAPVAGALEDWGRQDWLAMANDVAPKIGTAGLLGAYQSRTLLAAELLDVDRLSPEFAWVRARVTTRFLNQEPRRFVWRALTERDARGRWRIAELPVETDEP